MKPFRKAFTEKVKAESIHKTDAKMVKIKIRLLMIMLVVILLPPVKAGFACGIVNGTGDLEPQWLQVQIYHNTIEDSATCSVSPAGNKFCCDTEAIPGFAWKVNKEIKAEVFDSSYFSEPVSLYTTGQGYDVFPTIQLKKAIIVHDFDKIFLDDVYLNASFESPFIHIELEKNGVRDFLIDGEEYYGEIDADLGMNYLKLFVSGDGREFVEDLVFAFLEYVNFDRKITCKKCKDNVIKTNQKADIDLEINLSHYVEGLELREYVPVDFEILETDGKVEEYSATHNLIVWNVSGREIRRSYRVKAPNVWFFPKQFIFRTELENELLDEEEIVVSRFFSFWTFDEGIEFKSVKRKAYSRISPERPLVFKLKGEIVKIGIIPKQTIQKAELKVEEYTEGDLENAVSYYSFDTNINLEDIEKIFVEFRVNKTAGNLSLYVFEDGWHEWEWGDIEIVEEDEDFIYYQTYIDPTKKIALVGEEENSRNFLRLFN